MEIQLSLLAREALALIYELSDAELKKKLLAGASWQELKARIDFLTEVSKELHKHRIFMQPGSSSIYS